MSARVTLDQYIETLQILAHEGDADRTDAERERDAAHRAKLIDDFVHGLAEKLREEGAAWGKLSAAGKVYRAAADLIDPNGPAAEEAPRDELWDDLGIDPDRISREEFDEYMDAYDQAASAGPARPDEEATT